MKKLWNKGILVLGMAWLFIAFSDLTLAASGSFQTSDPWGLRSARAGDIVSYDHQKYNYSELKEDISLLAKRYSKVCQAEVIGTSPDDRDIMAVTIGNKNAKKHLVVLGNIHAREYMTTVLCMRQMEITLDNLSEKVGGKRISEILNQVAIHYIPSCNPDGTAISQYGHDAIRDTTLRNNLKNMNMSSYTTLWKANARGVDLNRNWNYGFYVRGKRGWQGFSGTKSFSEPETKAIRDYIRGLKGKGKVCGIISYHATGSLLYGKCLSKAKATVRKNTKRMSDVAQNRTGYHIMPQSKSTGGGYSREYYLYKANIPFITLEIGYAACPLPASEFLSIWRKNYDLVLLEALLFVS